MAGNTSWMKARQTKFAAYTAVYVIIVVAVVSVLNFLANRYNKTYDTTANKQFTLSDQTIKITKNLEVTSISYWDQPTRFQGAHDLLTGQGPFLEDRRPLRRPGKKTHESDRGGREAA